MKLQIDYPANIQMDATPAISPTLVNDYLMAVAAARLAAAAATAASVPPYPPAVRSVRLRSNRRPARRQNRSPWQRPRPPAIIEIRPIRLP